jgi:outer membrane immunogenic protein
MKGILLAGSAMAAVLIAGTANAADLPARVYKAPPIVETWSWTGFYVGVHVGGAWGTKEWTDPFYSLKGAFRRVGETAASYSVNGVLGGFQAGVNYQMGWVVVGAEAQFSWTGLRGTGNCENLTTFTGTTCNTKVPWLGTAALRLGGTIDHALLYVKGGAAWAHDQHDVFRTAWTNPSVSDTRWGYMVGAGVEYAFTANWSGKIEYDFMDFGKTDYHFAPLGVPGTTAFADVSIRQYIHLVKVGLNYRFGYSPVVAKY